MLHITNGDSAVRIMREAGVSGELLPWRDVLHEGPVPMTDSLAQLSQIRAQFIADQLRPAIPESQTRKSPL